MTKETYNSKWLRRKWDIKRLIKYPGTVEQKGCNKHKD
jgi:hypothetical protein